MDEDSVVTRTKRPALVATPNVRESALTKWRSCSFKDMTIEELNELLRLRVASSPCDELLVELVRLRRELIELRSVTIGGPFGPGDGL